MALSRRTGQRFQASIWPGFVDAMTGLLLVLTFVLTIFMAVQFVLRETISGQDKELDALSGEVAALAKALGLEQERSAGLEARVGALRATVDQAEAEIKTQSALIAALRGERDAKAAELAAAQTQITAFEAQVAALIADRDGALARASAAEGDAARLLEEQEALNLALAAARSEIDAEKEAARLAAAQREALEALIAEARAREDGLAADLQTARAALSAEEEARLALAAAAEALRLRLQNADAELTAMTLALEEQRKRAEETLLLLAAAQKAEKDLDAKLLAALAEQGSSSAERETLRKDLAAALAAKLAAEQNAAQKASDAEARAVLLAAAKTELAELDSAKAAAAKEAALLNQQVAQLRTQLGALQAILDDAKERDAAQKVQLQALGTDLNAALARAASEERKRRKLEEAERARLEAEARDLARYRSEFFGRMREILGAQEGVRIQGDRFVFSSEVLFPPGGAELSARGRQEIAKVARILDGVSQDIPPELNWVIRVDGHTDNIPLSGNGPFRDNWELSQARALSVVRYMVNGLGFAPEHLAANGFGEFQPLVAGTSAQARAKNRRIELKLTEK